MRRIGACLLLIAAAACGGDSPTQPTPASVAGVWNLQTVNGSGLPFILAQLGNDKVELTDDVLNVSENGTFTQLTHFRITQAGEVTTDSLPDAGTYALNGTAVTFTFESDGSTGTGSLSGNSLTVAAGGLALIYKKQ